MLLWKSLELNRSAGNSPYWGCPPCARSYLWLLSNCYKERNLDFGVESRFCLFWFLDDWPWTNHLNPCFILCLLLLPCFSHIPSVSLFPPLLVTCPQVATSRAITDPSTWLVPVDSSSRPYVEGYFWSLRVDSAKRNLWDSKLLPCIFSGAPSWPCKTPPRTQHWSLILMMQIEEERNPSMGVICSGENSPMMWGKPAANDNCWMPGSLGVRFA